jgi:DNA-binding transcriptional LysR family regulator
MPQWDHYRSFLAVCRLGSLSGAARAMGVAHPTVRRHLEELETGLGGMLFTRSPQGLLPTDLALRIRPEAERMAAAAEAIRREASGRAEAIAGRIRIGASDITGTLVLPAMLAALRQRHPGLAFELVLSNDQADILRRDVDVAVRMVRPRQDRLVARKVARIEIGLFAHEDWLARHGQPESAGALLAGRCLIGPERVDVLTSMLAGHGAVLERDHLALACDGDPAQFSALCAGLGVAAVQVPLALRQGGLHRVLPEIAHEMEVWLVTHPDLRASPAVAALIAGLDEALAAYALPGAGGLG